MKHCTVIVIALLVTLNSFVFGDSVYLLINPDARYSALAGAATARVNDVSALYYNPAGLAKSPGFSSSANYGRWLGDMKIYYAGSVKKLSRYGSLGTSLYLFDAGKYSIFDGYGHNLGEVHLYYTYLAFGYGCNLTKKIAVGSSFKFLFPHEIGEKSIDLPKGKGFSTDLGLQVTDLLPFLTFKNKFGINPLPKLANHKSTQGLSFGAAICNLGSAVKFSTDDYSWESDLTRRLRIGAAWYILDTDLLTTTISYDFVKEYDVTRYDDESNSNLLGLEFGLLDLLFIRYGKQNYDDIHSIDYSTWGVSIGPEWLRASYCRYMWADDPDFFSLSCAF